MVDYEGDSSSQDISLGWDSVTNFTGDVSKDNTNNYFINLTWNIPNINLNNVSIKYFINYLGDVFTTNNSYYKLPISYGNLITDEKTGIKIAEEVCVTIETRYYFSNGSYAVGELQSFCFCPPVDPFCKKSKKTKILQKNISIKQKYANAVKNKNGAMGLNLKNCSSVNEWKSLGFRLAVGKNDCYSKSNVLILPSSSDHVNYGRKRTKYRR
tara:strand:- start:46 stop:681 length:636 start_codon:yes stop_codon:yes gene_type:complete